MRILRRHRWWLIPELLAISLVAAALIYLRPSGLYDQLADRAQAVLEQLTPADLELYDIHGHPAAHDAKILCAAETFGMEPQTAARAEEVRIIYVRYLCALVQPQTPWDYASRSTGPAIITLGDSSSVQIAQSGTGYPDRVRALFPDSLETQAFAGFKDHSRPNALLARYREETA